MLSKTIDGLFIATRYLVWVLGMLGIAGSVILAIANVSMGLYAVIVFIATFFLSIAITIALAPEKLALPQIITTKKWTIVALSTILAVVLTGLVYFTQGGFPELNLLFL